MRSRVLLAVLLISCCLVATVDESHAWRSTLYGEDWAPPEMQQEPPNFEDDKLIQDFSYAGYRRSEVELPEVTGPIFDVVEDFGADPTGDTNTTADIQEAIDAAAEAGGGVVYLPAGTYRVRPPSDASASLRIRHSNVILRGAGPANTFILNDAWEMNRTDIIRVDSPGSGWATVPDDVTLIQRPALGEEFAYIAIKSTTHTLSEIKEMLSLATVDDWIDSLEHSSHASGAGVAFPAFDIEQTADLTEPFSLTMPLQNTTRLTMTREGLNLPETVELEYPEELGLSFHGTTRDPHST